MSARLLIISLSSIIERLRIVHRVLPQNNSPMNTESKSPALRIPANWPFAVNKWPFFYGWVVWLISTLGFLMSIPGQTMGMAVFTEPFINAFDLSRTQLSIAYMLGTLASALFLTRAGRLYDRLGARLIMVGSSVALAIVLLYFTVLDRLAAHLVGTPGVMFLLIMLGYFGVRFSGQGVLTSASRNVLMNWFARRRGRASGLRGVFVSLGFSLAPLVLAGMIGVLGLARCPVGDGRRRQYRLFQRRSGVSSRQPARQRFTS